MMKEYILVLGECIRANRGTEKTVSVYSCLAVGTSLPHFNAMHTELLHLYLSTVLGKPELIEKAFPFSKLGHTDKEVRAERIKFLNWAKRRVS